MTIKDLINPQISRSKKKILTAEDAESAEEKLSQ